MLEISNVFESLYNDLNQEMNNLGFKPNYPESVKKGEIPVFMRDDSSYLEYTGDKGKIRILFNENKIRLLSGEKDASSIDDSDYSLLASFLLILEEYTPKDVKSVTNEIKDNLAEAFSPKQLAKRQQQIKAQATVSRSQVKNGSMFYDPATLAIRLAAIYPEIKDEYKSHLEKYDEFLCEEFFTAYINPRVYETIKENNPVKMKKLFSIINEIYIDGTNEVQDIIVVTMLSSFDYQGDMWKNVLNYLNDAVDEPFIRVNKILKSSKTARLRLENPPKYKPKKKKKRGSMMSSLMGQQQ